MRVTKTELYDRYYSVYPDKADLYREDKEMEYNAFIESNKAAYTKLLDRYNKN